MISRDRDQISRFGEDGFILIERLINAAKVEDLRARFGRLFRGEFESGVRTDEVNWQEGRDDHSLTRQVRNGWKTDRAIARVVLDEGIGRALAEHAGRPGARLASLGACRSANGGDPRVRGLSRAARPAAAAERVAPEIVPVVVLAGGGAFHRGWTRHGSDPNQSQTERRAMLVHGGSSLAHFVPTRLGEGNGPVYGRYRRLGDHAMVENTSPFSGVARDTGRRGGMMSVNG